MLAAENSSFGVTGELLEETLVVQGRKCRWLKDRWAAGLKTLKTWHTGVASMLLVAVEALQALPSMFI